MVVLKFKIILYFYYHKSYPIYKLHTRMRQCKIPLIPSLFTKLNSRIKHDHVNIKFPDFSSILGFA